MSFSNRFRSHFQINLQIYQKLIFIFRKTYPSRFSNASPASSLATFEPFPQLSISKNRLKDQIYGRSPPSWSDRLTGANAKSWQEKPISNPGGNRLELSINLLLAVMHVVKWRRCGKPFDDLKIDTFPLSVSIRTKEFPNINSPGANKMPIDGLTQIFQFCSAYPTPRAFLAQVNL